MSLLSIAEAVNDLARLLEAKGLKHPRHAQHVAPARKRIKAVMVHFFERQRKVVLKDLKSRIDKELRLYPPPLKATERRIAEDSARANGGGLATAPLREAISPQGKTFARNLLPSSLQPLTFAATRAEENEYNDAITTLIGAAAKSLSASAAAAEDFAGDYLRSNSLSKLTGGLNSTSIERLQDALAGAWDGGGSYTEMVKAITDTFDDFSTKRAERIAQTEANDAYNGGRAQIAADLGMDEKKWDPDGEACPTCQANADAGWIDIGDDFPSGDDAPTAHPNCDCGTDYRKSSE